MRNQTQFVSARGDQIDIPTLGGGGGGGGTSTSFVWGCVATGLEN